MVLAESSLSAVQRAGVLAHRVGNCERLNLRHRAIALPHHPHGARWCRQVGLSVNNSRCPITELGSSIETLTGRNRTNSRGKLSSSWKEVRLQAFRLDVSTQDLSLPRTPNPPQVLVAAAPRPRTRRSQPSGDLVPSLPAEASVPRRSSADRPLGRTVWIPID